MNMKHFLVCLLIACMLLGLTGCAGQSTLFTELTDDAVNAWHTSDKNMEQTADMLGLQKMEQIATDGGMTLYLNKQTTEIAVKTKDGTVWYSNPQDRLGYNKNRLATYSSQLLVTQIDSSETTSVVNNFEESVQYGQFDIKKNKNGVDITYLFGKKVETPLYPMAMTIDKFEEILNQLDKSEQYKFKKYYGLIDMTNLTDQQTITAISEKYLNAADLGQIRVLKNSPSQIERNNVVKYLEECGFTAEDRDEQEKAVGFVGNENTTAYYVITMSYVLENGRLNVSIPADKIEASDNITIQGITVLPHWNTDKGVKSTNVLIPDGSGAIVNMGVTAASGTSQYKERFYGTDYALNQKNGVSNKNSLYFPIYGIMNKDAAMYGVATGADASAYMTVEPCSNVNTAPGYAGFYFQMVDTEEVLMSNDSTNTVTTYANEAVLDEIKVDYTFLEKGKKDWVAIAQDYKGRLEKENALSTGGATDKVPVNVNLLASVDDIKTVLGVPTEYIVPLTTAKQAEEIASGLKELLPDNSLIMEYDAWTKGGVKSMVQDKVRVESKVGKVGDIQSLIDKTKELGIDFYPMVDTQYVYRNKAFDAFTTTGGASRGIMREASYKADFNISNFMADADGFYGYLISPNKQIKFLDSFLESYHGKLSTENMGLTFLASDLSSDYNRDDFITRNRAKNMAVDQLAKATKDYKLLSKGANAYALSAVDISTDVALNCNANPLISYSVPFTQMLLSGTMVYTADMWNTEADSTYYTLKCIETGSAPSFTAIYADNSLLKYTNYDQYYSVNYESIKGRIQEVSGTITDALSDVYGHKMTGYERMTDLVVKVTYDNGKFVIVNYGNEAYTTPNGSVEAGSYIKG